MPENPRPSTIQSAAAGLATPLPSRDETEEADFDATRVMPTGGPAPLSHLQIQTQAPHTGETLPGSHLASDAAIRQVGRYLIRERLGRGGMASVFKAHDPSIGRDVAIKFLHPALCEDLEYHARFLREARAAGGLSHPNIVTVHDVGEIDGRPYMAMELLDGHPLVEEMADGKALPVRDVLVMGIQLARALDYAHRRGIVHRDIKPGNLMLLSDHQTVKVTDFGIAHIDGSGAEARTRVGDILGTPQYMSPEQAQGEKLDGRSDLFSTGILLYQMLCGQRPFLGDSLVALAVKIAREEPVPLERLRPELPASLRRIVERCLAKAPDRRFQTGEELAEALGRVLAEHDEQLRRQARPRGIPLRVRWAAIMALIVASVMGLTGAVVTQRQQSALMSQLVDSGAALARFIAQQNAAAALDEDWVSVQVSVQQIMKSGDFQSITVVDRNGIVRAASRPGLEGKPWQPLASETVDAHAGSSPVLRYQQGSESVLGFEAPITFDGRAVGKLFLGLREQPLTQVARLSITLMVVLVVVTVLAVALATYFLMASFSAPIKRLGEAMTQIARGHFEHRIDAQRRDELGEIQAAFDRMAQALQDRRAGVEIELPTPTSSHRLPPESP